MLTFEQVRNIVEARAGGPIPADMIEIYDWEEIARVVDAEGGLCDALNNVVSSVRARLSTQALAASLMGGVADHEAEVHAAHVRAEMDAKVPRTREPCTGRFTMPAITKQDRFYTGDQLRDVVLGTLGWAYLPPELEAKMASWTDLAVEANKGGPFVETLIETLRKDGNALASGAKRGAQIQVCRECATGRDRAVMREVRALDGEPFVTVAGGFGDHMLRWWYCPACGATTFTTEARERTVAKAPRAGAGWQLTAEDRHVLFDAINDRGEVLAAGGTIADLERAANEVLHVVREIATGAVSEFAAWLLRQEEWDKESCEDAAEQFIGETNSSSPAEWTRVAPNVPGYYWGRDEDGVRMYQRNDDGLWLVIDSENAIRPQDVVEWWPIPVEPPA